MRLFMGLMNIRGSCGGMFLSGMGRDKSEFRVVGYDINNDKALKEPTVLMELD